MGAGETKSTEARVPAAGAIKRLCGHSEGRGGDVSGRAFSDMIPIKMCCVLLGLYSRKNNWTEQLSFFIPPFLVLAQVCSCQQGLHSCLQHGFNLY